MRSRPLVTAIVVLCCSLRWTVAEAQDFDPGVVPPPAVHPPAPVDDPGAAVGPGWEGAPAWTSPCSPAFIPYQQLLTLDSDPRFLSADDLLSAAGIPAATEAGAAALLLSDYRPAQSMLPAAIDPNDLLRDPFQNATRLGDGRYVQPLGPYRAALRGEDSRKEYAYRPGADAKWSGIYDTGFVSGVWDVSNIALEGSANEHRRGNFQMTTFGGNLQFDVQGIHPRAAGDHLTQGYIEMRYFDDEVAVYRLYGRWIMDDLKLGLFAGKHESLWGDLRSLPRSINQSGPARGTLLVGGTGLDETVQFVVTSFLSEQAQLSMGVENPTVFTDVVTAPTDQLLSRWPIVIGRARLIGGNGWDTYQVAGLLRPFGIEDTTTSDEEWSIGWGVQASAHRRFGEDLALYAGGGGGNGIGRYLEGLEHAAAGPAGRAVSPVSGFGAFGGLSYKWWESIDQDALLWSNLACGYARQESHPFLPDEAIRNAREAWCNLLHRINQNAAWGVEYRYGRREVRDGRTGDDHRIQLVFQLSTGGADEKDIAQNVQALYAKRVDPGPTATTYLRRP